MSTNFVVQRNDLRNTHWDESPPRSLDDGEVRMRIDVFALTSNNITYAAFGDVMNYWQFYPTGDPDTGRVPVWGFATVVESRCPGVEVDERFYGYWPIADEVVLHAADVHPGGFADGSEHRSALHAVYNQYVRCSADPGYRADREAQQALLRPLFATSFLIDDFLADNAFFGAKRVKLSSASCKTSYGTAFRLGLRGGEVTVVGLTSPANADFTRCLGVDGVHGPHRRRRASVDDGGDATRPRSRRAVLHGAAGRDRSRRRGPHPVGLVAVVPVPSAVRREIIVAQAGPRQVQPYFDFSDGMYTSSTT